MATDKKMAGLIHKSGIRLVIKDGQNARFLHNDGHLICKCRSIQPTLSEFKSTSDSLGSGLIVTEKNNFPEIMRQLAAMN